VNSLPYKALVSVAAILSAGMFALAYIFGAHAERIGAGRQIILIVEVGDSGSRSDKSNIAKLARMAVTIDGSIEN
jgi:hypothetical protein